MKSMYEYNIKRKHLSRLFRLDGSSKSFSEFGKLVGMETRSAHVWIAFVQRIIKLEK